MSRSFGCGRPADGGAVAAGGGGIECSRGEIPRSRNLLQVLVVILAELAESHRRVYHRLIGRLDAVLLDLRQLIGPLPHLERVGEISLNAVGPLLLHSGEQLGGLVLVAGVQFPQLLLRGGLLVAINLLAARRNLLRPRLVTAARFHLALLCLEEKKMLIFW